MGRRSKYIAIFCLILLAMGIPSLQAYWTEDGVAICTATDFQYYPQIISDGAGGAIIAWYDRRSGDYDIYAQKINAAGTVQWTADGVAVCIDPGYQMNPRLVSDGSGGAIITWEDNRSGDYDIYAQRITAAGIAQWRANGVAICNVTSSQDEVEIISDGAGGAIITWEDAFTGTNDIYAQRINAGGMVQWQTNGNPICIYTDNQNNPSITPDGAGGAIIAWQDHRSVDSEIYGQRVNADGYLLWGLNGAPICTEPSLKNITHSIPDGTGGMIVAWTDNRGGYYDIYIQRISASSSVLWEAAGLAICTLSGAQRNPTIVSDGAEGAIITWDDERNGIATNDIYAQKVNASGTVQWTINGIPICSAIESQRDVQITSDKAGGAIIIWSDYRNASHSDIYGQRIDAGGAALWAPDGIALITATDSQDEIRITPDGRGGALITWEDKRTGGIVDIYAQQINRNGLVGYMSPEIHSVADVPDDQGGLVNIAWDASRSDPFGNEITEYTIWRALGTPAAALLLSKGAALLGSAAEIADAGGGPVVRKQLLGGQTYYWELIDSHPAYYLEGYSKIVPTAFDSCAVTINYHFFQIIAHTQVPTTFYISAPDSGYSVDNIAPCPPLCLAGEQSYSPEGLEITWTPNTEPDLDCYKIYRGADPGFIPGTGNLIASPCDTLYFDGDWRWDNMFCYKVAAVDVNGNESEYVLLCSSEVTGDDTPVTSQATFLEQNYPNPFNPVTRIAFGLEVPARVSLRIYDSSGRLVRVLVEAEQPAGTYEMMWDGKDDYGLTIASGIYFYRLVAGDFVQTKKMVLLR